MKKRRDLIARSRGRASALRLYRPPDAVTLISGAVRPSRLIGNVAAVTAPARAPAAVDAKTARTLGASVISSQRLVLVALEEECCCCCCCICEKRSIR